jgi:hypothetical protein
MFQVELDVQVEGGGIAFKTIELPFAPYEGLRILEKAFGDGTVMDEFTISDVAYRVATKSFSCSVWFGLQQEIDVNIGMLESRGWKEY